LLCSPRAPVCGHNYAVGDFRPCVSRAAPGPVDRRGGPRASSTKVVGMADLDLRSPFTYRQARRAGMSRRRLEGAQFREVVRGIYVSAAAAELESRALAGLLVAAEATAFVSHHDAARMWGAVVPHSPVIHVSVPADRPRRRRDGVTVHASRRSPVRRRGIPVTSPVDTFLDLARELDLVDLVVLGDSLVRRGVTTPEALVAAAEAASGRSVRPARRAARLVRAGVDSAMETRTRLLMVLAGLPEPEVNIVFLRPDGSVARRLDLGYRDLRLAVEYDGYQHHKERAVYEEDLIRREQFEQLDWRIVTLVSKDVYVTPGLTLERLVAALRARGATVPRLRQEWKRYFPVSHAPPDRSSDPLAGGG